MQLSYSRGVALIAARAKRDSLAERALWGSVALGLLATLAAVFVPLATWLICSPASSPTSSSHS